MFRPLIVITTVLLFNAAAEGAQTATPSSAPRLPNVASPDPTPVPQSAGVEAGVAAPAVITGENASGAAHVNIGVLGITSAPLDNLSSFVGVKGMGGAGSGFTPVGRIGVWADSDGGFAIFATARNGHAILAECENGTCPSGGNRYAGWFRGGDVRIDQRLGVGITPNARLQVEEPTLTGLYVHSTSGYAINARSDTNYAALFEGRTYFTDRMFLHVLGANGDLPLCLNTASEEVSACGNASSRRDKSDVNQTGGVNYNQLSAVLVNAIKEQQDEIRTLRDELMQQRDTIAAQQRQIGLLQRRVDGSR